MFGDQAVILTSNTLAIYDADTNGWSQASIPGATNSTGGAAPYFTREAPLALLDGKVFYLGTSSYGNVTDVGIYDIASGLFSTHALQDAHAFSGVVNGKLVFMGGEMFDGGPQDSNLVEFYDSATHAWATATLPQAVGPAWTEVLNDNVLTANGNALEVFDADTDASHEVALSSQAGYLDERLTLVDGVILSVDNGDDQPPSPSPAVDVFAASPIGQPSDPNVAAGAGLATSPNVLTWATALGATSYDVYVDDALVGNVTSNQWTPVAPLTQGAHSWQIVARDGSDLTAGPRWQFTVGAPATPADPSVPHGATPDLSPLQLSWSPARSATSYDVYLDGKLFETTTFTTVPIAQPLIGGSHTWQVIAKNNLTTTAGPAWHFTLPVSNLAQGTETLPSPVYGSDMLALTLGDLGLFVSQRINEDDVEIFNAATQHWSSTTLSKGRSDLGFATVGTKALFAGGDTDYASGFSNAVDIFDALTGRWSTAALSAAREDVSGASAGNFALFAGGLVVGKRRLAYSNVVDVYDDLSGLWGKAKLSQPREVGAQATVDGKILFAGGLAVWPSAANNYLGGGSDVVDIFDSATGTWSVSHLPEAAADLESFVVGDKAYFASGSSLFVYDAVRCAWSTIAAPRSLAGIPPAVKGNSVFFPTYNEGLVIFDAASGRWKVDNNIPDLSYTNVQFTGSKAIFAYGSSDDLAGVANVLDLRTGQWSVRHLALPGNLDAYESGTLAGVSLGGQAVYLETGLPGSVSDTFIDPDAKAPAIAIALTQVPSAMISNATYTVKTALTNDGDAPLAAPFSVNIYKSVSGRVDAHSMLLGTTVVNTPLDGGATTPVSVKVQTDATIGAGAVNLVAVARTVGGDNVAVAHVRVRLRGSIASRWRGKAAVKRS